MKRNGNANTNRTFNPQNTKPPIPLDVDEVDAVLEKFIKQKYDQQLFSGGHSRRPATRNDTGSTRSSEDQPPPLPPKPGKRFGFGLRSASSMLPLSRNSPTSPPRSPHDGTNGFGAEPIRVNKQSRVFGASVGGGGGEMEAKLAQLKDMGFGDEKRNASILKGMNGNLERAIETLVRLGEGSAPTSRSRTPNQARNIAVSQPLPSQPPSAQNTGVVNGISFAASGAESSTSIGSQGQQSQSGTAQLQAQANRSFSPSNPYQSQAQSYNPFNIPSEQPALERAFSGMQIAPQQQQPLFPNATGGYPSQPPPAQDTRFQTMTPPVPQMPQQFIQSNPYLQQNSDPNQNYNPFYQTTQQTLPPPTNPYVSHSQTSDTQQSYNPFQQHQPPSIPQQFINGYFTESAAPYAPPVQQDSNFQHNFHQQQNPQSQVQQQQFSNPYAHQHSMTNPSQYSTQHQSQQPQQFDPYQLQPLRPQQTGRIDKSSILALYNYPQLAPPPLPNDPNAASSAESSMAPMANMHPGVKQAQRSVTMPVQPSSGSRNPFQSAASNADVANGTEPRGARHVSQESVNGRHSPDAFASLSARFVR